MKWLELRQKRSLCPQNHSVLQKQLNAATASCGQTQGLVRTTIPWLGVPTIDTVFGAFRMKNVLMASSAIVGVAALVASPAAAQELRSEEHTSELQSLMRISYAVFCLKKKNITLQHIINL